MRVFTSVAPKVNRWVVWLVLAAAVSGFAAPLATANESALRFQSDGTNGFTFDTGELRGQLRAGGKSMGLSSVVHVPTGMRLDSSLGLFSIYRVFSAHHRYGTAAWDWSSQARLMPDGSVAVNWPATNDRPFELRAVYRWATAKALDLEITATPQTNLAAFEVFLASYFSEGFTNATVYARSKGQSSLMAADRSFGMWLAFPRDDQAVELIQDGRWKLPPNPVDWTILPQLAKPLAVRRCRANDLRAVVMSPPQDCFAVLLPYESEPHRSLYLSLLGRELRAGESARARARLRIGTELVGERIDGAYSEYLAGHR